MTAGEWFAFSLLACIGCLAAAPVARMRARHAPSELMRTNISGADIPAVLGDAVAAGSLAGALLCAGLAAADADAAPQPRMTWAIAIVAVVMWAAGRYDDLRGGEDARGFGGHLRAVARGRLTGGAVKIAAGLVAGAAAGMLLDDGTGAVVVALVVALSANLVNLADAAPGRAVKVAVILTGVGLVAAGADWRIAAAGALGALVAVAVPDLSERAMLGDAGANPLGAVVGVGLAVGLSGWARMSAVVVLAALNLASERWSYSDVISRTPWLRALDSLGRTKRRPNRAR